MTGRRDNPFTTSPYDRFNFGMIPVLTFGCNRGATFVLRLRSAIITLDLLQLAAVAQLVERRFRKA